MLGPSNAVTNDLPDFTVLQTLPLPLLVLSFDKTILVATEAVERLLAWSQWHSAPLVGCSLAELGVSLATEEGCEEQDLDALLDQMACEHMNAAGQISDPSERTGKNNRQKRGNEDSESSSKAQDTESGAWQEDWYLEFLVDVQRAPHNRSFVRAKLSMRIWSTNKSPLYVLTFAKPMTPSSSSTPSVCSPSAGKDAREAKKSTTLSQILDYMPNLSWIARPDGEPDYFSERWYDYTHASRTETLKDLWARTVHPEDKVATWDNWIECTLQGQAFKSEVRYKRFDGMYRYQLVHGVPQRNDGGEIVQWHGTCTDIHELVTQRIEASRLKQQILMVLSHGDVNLFGLDKNMEVTMLEGSIKWGTQASAAEKAAPVENELVNSVEAAAEDGTKGTADFIAAVQKILRGDSTMEVLEHFIDKRWYRSRFVADVEPNNETGQDTIRGILGLSIDITDMKARTALELEKTQLVANETAAKEANMLKSQFLANMSHELRTPISGVLGMAELLAETPLADEQREYARGISQSADSLLGIVNDILDASKIEAGRFDVELVEFDLSDVVEDLYKMMAYSAQRKQLHLDYKTALKPFERVIGDPGRTRQILVNLLANAVKFTSKGIITLTVSASESEDTLTVVFTVEDTGVGIEDAVLRKLFRPFSQGDSSTARLFGGTGLGLTICKELAALMHGSIRLASTPNIGSKATFSIPFKRPLNRRASKEIPEPVETSLHDTMVIETNCFPDRDARPLRRTSPGLGDSVTVDAIPSELPITTRAHTQVLVVEDNTINQNIAVQVIRKLGFPVQAVWNGKEALEYLANPTAINPRPHIVIMDCQMPIMDGYEATRRLRNSSDVSVDISLRKVPVIALTASAIKGDKEKCKAAGMDDYLIKPIGKKELESVLVKWTIQIQNLGR